MAKTKKPKKKVVSASPAPKRKRKRGPMNLRLAQAYIAELDAALGRESFSGIFSRIKDDKEIRQEEAVSIASTLLETKIASSTARGAALARILKLHNSLVTFKLKQKAVGGRSAA